MQHEKLYNLQTKVYFNCIHFLFKKSKTLCDQFSPFCYLVITEYVSFKKNKIYHKMQRAKLYSLQRTVYFICVLFMFKKTPNSV